MYCNDALTKFLKLFPIFNVVDAVSDFEKEQEYWKKHSGALM